MLDCCCDLLVSKYFTSWSVVGRSVPPFVPHLVSNAGGRTDWQAGDQCATNQSVCLPVIRRAYNTDYLLLFPGSPSYVHWGLSGEKIEQTSNKIYLLCSWPDDNINLLLTEREGRTGEYWAEVMALLTERNVDLVERGSHKKMSGFCPSTVPRKLG